MVDIDQLSQFGVARIVYCIGKCLYERGLPHPEDPDYPEQRLAFLRCVADCSAPIPLPDRDDEDEDEDENQ